MLRAFNLKFDMWIGLGDRTYGIEDGHNGAPYGVVRGDFCSLICHMGLLGGISVL